MDSNEKMHHASLCLKLVEHIHDIPPFVLDVHWGVPVLVRGESNVQLLEWSDDDKMRTVLIEDRLGRLHHIPWIRCTCHLSPRQSHRFRPTICQWRPLADRECRRVTRKPHKFWGREALRRHIFPGNVSNCRRGFWSTANDTGAISCGCSSAAAG